jgi:RecA-family ATPase
VNNPFLAGLSSLEIGPAEAEWLNLDFLCRDLGLVPGPVGIVIGIGFSGKTYFCQELALCVATGRKFLGRYPVKAGKVLHLDYEMSSIQTRVRYRRLANGANLRPGALANGRLGMVQPEVKLNAPEATEHLAAALDGYTLAIVDSFRAAVNGDENSSDVRHSLDLLGRASEKANCTVLVIMHSGKSQNSDNRFAARGSSALYDAAGAAFTLSVKGEEPNKIYTVKQIKSRTGWFKPAQFSMKDVGKFIPGINMHEGISLVHK